MPEFRGNKPGVAVAGLRWPARQQYDGMQSLGMRQSVQYLTDEDGKRTAVVIPMRKYRQMLQDLEDLHDLVVIAERRNDPLISHEEVLAELKREGVL
jgi:hypothetical protein